tara:strand:+ start:2811 stop:3173 length:363 start_codon:yes stop_codon:yes gene_type:complete
MKKKWKGKKVVETKSEFREDVEVKKKIVDSTGSSGTTGQVLTTTGSVVTWTDRTFIYTKANAADTWVITHNLNLYPSVTVVDTGGSVIRGEIVFNTINKLTITFFSNGSASAIDGKAYLN